jgi:glutamine amidotransferase
MIAILDSGTANLMSVAAAFERMNVTAEITADPAKLRAASHVILPGVGSAGAAMRALELKGLCLSCAA